ncbi:NUDIX phosphohydrolase, putative [Bodo saltans]|uniref:NUDIX phosphohydrolase, putative n=1 Tax=Bodo saltans TaxID=75058 RepID=A0A0S4IT34_BODSA|nr:NUDIX phosphohydrolase, putative [Bodo saltans]|eukprot:CUF11394.1 NUDIX phosphohydrolase, putative [Bodo saltans]
MASELSIEKEKEKKMASQLQRAVLVVRVASVDVPQDLAAALPSNLKVESLEFNGSTEASQFLIARLLNTPQVESVIIVLPPNDADAIDGKSGPLSKDTLSVLAATSRFPHIFSIIFSDQISKNPAARYAACSLAKCHMVTHVINDLKKSLSTLANETRAGDLECPVCKKRSLTPIELRDHLPMFHINCKKTLQLRKYPCPICKESSSRDSIVVHVHDEHAPSGVHVESGRSMPKVVSFGLCVIQRKRDKKFLVVQEYENQGYWLPGGGIDGSEMPDVAAQRECLEEAGIHATLTGVLRVEVTPPTVSPYMRLRYIFYGHPTDEDEECKTFPDFESVGACWVSVDDLDHPDIQWRGDEPHEWFRYVANGGVIAPITFLTREGAPVQLVTKPVANIN